MQSMSGNIRIKKRPQLSHEIKTQTSRNCCYTKKKEENYQHFVVRHAPMALTVATI